MLRSTSSNEVIEILYSIRQQLKHRGQHSLSGLLRNFNSADADQNGYLSRDEFAQLFENSGIFLKKVDITYLMNYFDSNLYTANKDGRVSFGEFFEQVCPPLNPRRLQAVQAIYNQLGPRVTVDTVVQSYNGARHPSVVTGGRPLAEVTHQFMEAFNAYDLGPNAPVSEQQFIQAYRTISAGYPDDDDAFIRMLEQVWGFVEGGKGSEDDLTLFALMLRDKLRLRMKGAETEQQVLLRAFKFVDLDDNGHLSFEEFRGVLERLGVQMPAERTEDLFQRFDKDGSGFIDYYEFAEAICAGKSHYHRNTLNQTLYANSLRTKV